MPGEIRSRITLAGKALLGKSAPRQSRKDIPSITEAEIAEIKSFFPLAKFFIFGHARSGTTVLVRLIRQHPDVHCNYQAHFFTRPPLLQSLVENEEVGSWLQRPSNRWNNGKDLSPVCLRAAADFILEREARQKGKHIVGDKSPNSLMNGESVHLMRKIYPDAHLIFIVRDGRDAAISHRFQAFIDFPHKLSKQDLQIRADFSRNPTPYMRGEKSIFTQSSILQAAKGWVENVNQTDKLGKELYKAHYGSLRFEDLLAQPLQEMNRLWSFLGADANIHDLENALNAELERNPDVDWQVEKASNIAQSLQKGGLGVWREIFTSRDRDVFHQIAGETLQTWGYDL